MAYHFISQSSFQHLGCFSGCFLNFHKEFQPFHNAVNISTQNGIFRKNTTRSRLPTRWWSQLYTPVIRLFAITNSEITGITARSHPGTRHYECLKEILFHTLANCSCSSAWISARDLTLLAGRGFRSAHLSCKELLPRLLFPPPEESFARDCIWSCDCWFCCCWSWKISCCCSLCNNKRSYFCMESHTEDNSSHIQQHSHTITYGGQLWIYWKNWQGVLPKPQDLVRRYKLLLIPCM